jgi:hypothetical protein
MLDQENIWFKREIVTLPQRFCKQKYNNKSTPGCQLLGMNFLMKLSKNIPPMAGIIL